MRFSSERWCAHTGDSGDASVPAFGNYAHIAWEDNTPLTGGGGSFEVWFRVGSQSALQLGKALSAKTPQVVADDSCLVAGSFSSSLCSS
jgi:hypothetical protein